MQQAAQSSSSRTALTQHQVRLLDKERSILEERLAEVLGRIQVEEQNLESQQKNTMNQNLIQYSIHYKEDISAIQMWISQGLKEEDYDHKIIKFVGISKPKPKPRNLTSRVTPVIDKESQMHSSKLKQMQYYPFIKEQQDLYDFGKFDLNQNLQTVNQAKGKIEHSKNYLSEVKCEEPLVHANLQQVDQVTQPQIRQGLDLLYLDLLQQQKLTNSEQKIHATQQSSDNIEEIRKIQAQKIHLQQSSSSKLQIIAKPLQVSQSQLSSLSQQQQSFVSQKSSQTMGNSLPQDFGAIMENPQGHVEEPARVSLPPGISEFDKVKQNQRDQAKNGAEIPPADPKVMYHALSLEKRFPLLSQLLQQKNLIVYSELLVSDSELEKSEEFQTVLKPIIHLIKGEKWDRISISIFKIYLKGDKSKHYAMKIYFTHEKPALTSPLLMHQAYETIQKVDVPIECQEFHDDFVENFSRLTVQQLNISIDDMSNEFEAYKAELVEIMKSLLQSGPKEQEQKIVLDTALDQLLNGFEVDFNQYRSFQMAKEAFNKNDIGGASLHIRQMMKEMCGKHSQQRIFCEMYALLIKKLPDFQIKVSEKKVFSTFAPDQLKNVVRELFEKLKIQVPFTIKQKHEEEKLRENQVRMLEQDQQISKIISEKLEEIFLEDSRFYEMLLWYLNASTDYSQVVIPLIKHIKPLKILQHQHLEKAFSQIQYKGKHPQSIAQFMSVDIDMDLQKLQKSIGDWYRNNKVLNGNMITLVLYDLIKKRCTFEKFMTHIMQQKINGSDEILFTQQFLISFLLNNSDTYLRTMLLMTCSFFMPLPLVTFKPKLNKNIPQQVHNHGSKNEQGVQIQSQSRKEKNSEMDTPQDEKQIEFLPFVYEELFYCFEKHMAVLAFKVSANPNKSPQGCTSLTNSVFNRTFQTHSQSLVNYGTIEIQFDYNFEHPMFVPVADAHGLVEEEILEQVYPMFNIFMIHSFIGVEHQDVVNRQITKIRQKTKNPLIFLIIHDEERKDKNYNISPDQTIVKIMICRYSDLLANQKDILIEQIVQIFLNHIDQFKAQEEKVYEENIPARLSSLKDFYDFSSGFRAYRNKQLGAEEEKTEDREFHDQIQLKEALDITRSFLKMIDENKHQLRSDKVLNMNVLFEEACYLDKIMVSDTSLKTETCEKYRLKVEQLYQEMKKSNPSPLTQELRKIIDHQNYLGLTSIISKFIRSVLNFNLQPVLKQRENLRTQVQKPDLQLKEKELIVKQIKDITEKLKKSWYSNEFLYREYYISEHSKLRLNEKFPAQPFTNYLSIANLQISQGQPFEIIDGNNLQFIKEVYQKIESHRILQEDILVVSVLGPQSSGKSLLLNTLFGAQFLSSAGRCTRGIYGCLIDIKSDIIQTKFKKILILDSEGIQSTEADDDAFDKRVVFYILCVSHVVLICNKGEMNKNMEDTIKLATDSIIKVREMIVQQPQVNIIMNNVQSDETTLFNTIQNLSNSIIEMKCNEQLRQIFTIDQNNVFLLHNAFAQTGNERFVAYKPSHLFAQQVDKIRKRIIEFMKHSTKENTDSYTLETWFQFAQKFWLTTEVYAGVTEYSTLEEKKQDILLFDYAKKLIAENFEDPKMVENHKQMIIQGVNSILEQHQGYHQTNINIIQHKIDDVLQPRYIEVENRIKEIFRKFIEEKGIRQQIERRQVEQLDTQIRQHLFNWKQHVQKLLGEFNQKKSKFIGEKSLQTAIDQFIQANNNKITHQEAEQIFQKEWYKIENEMKKQLKTQEQVYEEQFKDIGQLYRANARQNKNIDRERKLINSYKELDSQVLRKFLVSQKDFLFYNSKTSKPPIELFKQQIAREKHFLKNKLEFFEEINSQVYYDWKKVINERFQFVEYEKFITEDRQLVPGKRKGITEKQVAIIITQIREEAGHFNVDITKKFEERLNNLEEKEIQPSINDQRQNFKKDSFEQDEQNCVGRAIRKYVHDIQNTIELYFKYKSGDIMQQNITQMKFFDKQNVRDYNSTVVKVKKYKFYPQSYYCIQEPQDSKIVQIGLQLINKRQKLKIMHNLKQQDELFFEYLEFLIQEDINHIASATMPVQRALEKFFKFIDHEKLISSIQRIVLENIFRDSKEKLQSTVEALVQQLIQSQDPNITQKFCAMDFKTIQRVVISVENVISKINEDMEPYSLKVSEEGSSCLHQIAQTYIIRIMQEVIRLTEHSPLYTFIKTKNVQKDLFIAKLTSNDMEMDKKLAERTARSLVQMIANKLKDEEIQDFQQKIEGEQNLFKMKTIIKNIENQVLRIANGQLPYPFQFEIQPPGNWLSKLINNFREEEKKEEFLEKIFKFKKLDDELEFSPQEIIMFYVQPSEFLKKKFEDQWTKVTGIEIKKAQEKYAYKIKQINQQFQKYFQKFQNHIQLKKMKLATNLFVPMDQHQHSSHDIVEQKFKVQCQKATAIYLGQVVNKEWKAGTPISVNDLVKMIVPQHQSLVTHEDIGIEFPQPYARYFQKTIQNELISNIENFIKSLISEIQNLLDIKIQGPNLIHLDKNDLIGDLFQLMKTKTLGCDQMCPLCRRQCDQPHDYGIPANRIHKCENGHQIQGFGGNRNKLNNRAITYGCHELEEKDMVFWQGSDINWKSFKQEIFKQRRWDLEDNKQGAKQLIKEKNIKIWNLIGPIICDYYRLGQQIDIKFIQADMNDKRTGSVLNTFYILMLDNSGSMGSQDQNGQSKWINLTKAVSQFIASIENDILQKNNSIVSIITYNSDATLEIEAKVPSQSIVESLSNKDPDGNTEFNPPIQMATDLMEQYNENYDSFVLVMMSDGEAQYPQDGVENIKKSPAKNKLKFKSIAYGGGSECLSKMAQELGGTCEEVLEPNQLSSAFIQMIPNLYAQ